MSAPRLHRRAGRRRAVVRAAFAPFAPRPRVAYRHAQRWSARPPRVWTGPASGERLAVIVPTVTRGAVTGPLRDGLARVADAAAALTRSRPDVACLLVVALYEATAPDRAASLVEALERDWQASGSAAPWVGVAVSEPSKVLALNSTAPLLDANGVSAVTWFDDDVDVAPDCLLALWRAYEPGAARVYGARALPATGLRPLGAPGNPYPYGCSMLMSRATFGAGIPLVYMSDDHYYLLALLDPEADDPLHRLRVVPDAVVRVGPSRSWPAAVRRVARNYRNVQRVLADTDPAAARYFRRRVHFAALRAPRDPAEARSAGYWRGQAVQVVRLALWCAVVAEVHLRGLLARPRPAYWCSDHAR